MKILFVCTGNTCRSPMAEYIAAAVAPQHEYSSAGLAAGSGAPSPAAVQAMSERGIDISQHSARQLDMRLAEQADIIVPMTAVHRAAMIAAGVDERKIRPFAVEIPDPYGGDIAVYRDCRDQLYAAIEQLVCELNGD